MASEWTMYPSSVHEYFKAMKEQVETLGVQVHDVQQHVATVIAQGERQVQKETQRSQHLDKTTKVLGLFAPRRWCLAT